MSYSWNTGNPYDTPARQPWAAQDGSNLKNETRRAVNTPSTPVRTTRTMTATKKENRGAASPFAMMGSKFKDLDASRFKKSTESNKLAMERLYAQSQSDSSESSSSDEESFFSASEGYSQGPPSPPSTPPRTQPRSRPGYQEEFVTASHGTKASSSGRVLRQVPVATSQNALLTPPPSSRKPTTRPVVNQEFNVGDYPVTPSKAPRRKVAATVLGSSQPNRESSNPFQPSKKDLTEIRPVYSLPTPDPSPVKQATGYHGRPTKAPKPVPALLFPPPPPTRTSPSSGSAGQAAPPLATLFRPLNAEYYPMTVFKTKQILVNGNPFSTYVADNGDVFKWYQSLDADDIVSETMTRVRMKLDGDESLKDVPQGRILNYEMGLGKTHVAVAVVVETDAQTKAMYQQRNVPMKHKPVLIIADKSLQKQWADHMTSVSGGKLTVRIYTKNKQPMPSTDVIIVNIVIFRNQYTALLAYWEAKDDLYKSGHITEKPDRANPTKDDLERLAGIAPFFITEFRYVVIDEFHSSLANPATYSSRSVLTLRVDHVLLLSGTPAQNKLDDLQVPVALLQHHSKRKNYRAAEEISRRLDKDMKAKDVVHFISFAGATSFLFSQIIIARRIDPGLPGCEPLITLPNRLDHVVVVNLSEEESLLDQYMSENISCPLVRVLRRRQACLHPDLLTRPLLEMHGLIQPDPDLLEEIQANGEDVTEEFESVQTDAQFFKVSQMALEPPTASGLPAVVSQLGIDELFEDEYLSSKFKVVLGILRKVRKEGKGEKTLIFSSFTSLLSRLAQSLDDYKIGHVTFSGEKGAKQRQEALHTIANDKGCSVMLVSLKAGGTGLNITSCNNVIILDPWWNPYVEEQAISRVHRMGQTRQVSVYRLISPNTIEKRITDIQEKKRVAIDGFNDGCVRLTMSLDATRKQRGHD